MNRSELSSAFQTVRQTTRDLCRPLCTEDYVIQSMPDVSPPKWHLGHTTWFFERMILEEFADNYRACHPRYYFVFNSYYQSFGQRVARDIRGTLSRPTVQEVYAYRAEVDEKVVGLIGGLEQGRYAEFSGLVELGLHHEQQHQELLVTDVKHILASNPLRPTYRACDGDGTRRAIEPSPPAFHEFEAGMFEMGAPDRGFAWDNERPRHKTWLSDYGLKDRPVTCGEYLDFMKDGGYREPLLWLSDGWDAVIENGWRSPLYWDRRDGDWEIVTLRGSRPLDPAEPVAHISFYEADAYARWENRRLPTEAEWERAARQQGNPLQGNFLENGRFHPAPGGCGSRGEQPGVRQLFGDVWEWTGSAYLPYPGYRQDHGPLGEYNGKFMSNRMVLRGGSCATPKSHIRPSYRNFFQCDKRWQFTGVRLAKDLG